MWSTAKTPWMITCEFWWHQSNVLLLISLLHPNLRTCRIYSGQDIAAKKHALFCQVSSCHASLHSCTVTYIALQHCHISLKPIHPSTMHWTSNGYLIHNMN